VENFDRGSESTCRSPIDVLLNTCLVLLKGMRFDPLTGSRIENSAPTPTAAGDASIQPNPFADSILVNGEVSLEWTDPDTLVTWSGRIDYAIGIVHPNATTSHFPPSTSAPPEKNPRLPYQAYLLVVEAKRSQDVDAAVAQLFGYLAVLHKLRKGSGGTGSSREVYGVATDGLKWDFLRITEDGVMQVGRRIELEGGSEEIRRVVGGVLGILQTEVEVVSEIVRLVKSAGSGTGSRVPSIERPTLKQHPLEEGGCQVHTGEVVGVPSLGSTLQEALIDVETGAGGDVLVDAAALDIRDTEYVKGNVEENS